MISWVYDELGRVRRFMCIIKYDALRCPATQLTLVDGRYFLLLIHMHCYVGNVSTLSL